MSRRRPLAALALALLLPAGPALSGEPFLINGEGQPLLWPAGTPVVFNLDLGPLGILPEVQARALALESFAVWGSVPTSSLSFLNGPPLPCNLSPSTFGACGPDNLQVVGQADDGLSPVVFDQDGSLFNFLFGTGASADILGYAAIVDGTYLPPTVLEAEVVLNGLWWDGVQGPGNPEASSLGAYQAVFVHEIGHWINIDHSQINIQFWADGDAANDAYLPTMFPSTGDDDTQLLSLNEDDISILTTMYPAPTGKLGYAELRSLVFSQPALGAPPGTVGPPYQGANVILRMVDDAGTAEDESLIYAYSFMSGGLYAPVPPLGYSYLDYGGPPEPLLEGAFYFLAPPGLYTLEIEEIEPLFAGGSGIGPLLAPRSVPGPDEYWNAGESHDPTLDPPTAASNFRLEAEQFYEGADILLNEPLLPPSLYAVDDQLFNPAVAGITAIIELDQATGAILRRIPAPVPNSAFQEGLAFAGRRGTLFFTDGAFSGRPAAQRLIYELDPVDGSVINSFPWPASAQRLEGLAFLDGPSQPAGGVLYALDGAADAILGLDPDTGAPKGFDITAGSDLFGALGGAGDDLFVTSFGSTVIHLRPSQPGNPVVNFITKPALLQFDPGLPLPGIDQFLVGGGFDGEDLYLASIEAPDFRIWRIDPTPATDRGGFTKRLDVISGRPDPTPIRPGYGGFSAVDVAMRGDIDGTRRVDGFDLARLARAFATSSGGAGFDPRADLDRDDDVDENDLTVLAAYFGRGI